jgi:hypothetical protein
VSGGAGLTERGTRGGLHGEVILEGFDDSDLGGASTGLVSDRIQRGGSSRHCQTYGKAAAGEQGGRAQAARAP